MSEYTQVGDVPLPHTAGNVQPAPYHGLPSLSSVQNRPSPKRMVRGLSIREHFGISDDESRMLYHNAGMKAGSHGYYHVAPRDARETIERMGLHGHEGDWGDNVWAWTNRDRALRYASPDDDVWEITHPHEYDWDPSVDPGHMGEAAVSDRPIHPDHVRRLDQSDIMQEGGSTHRHGDCDAFALALHNLSGWPIYKIAENPNRDAWHFMIQHPLGGFIDGSGLRGVDDILNEHDYEDFPMPDIFPSSVGEVLNYRGDVQERAKRAENAAREMLKESHFGGWKFDSSKNMKNNSSRLYHNSAGSLSPRIDEWLANAVNAKGNEKPQGWEHGSISELVLREGQGFRPAPESSAEFRGDQNSCFKNVTHAVLGMGRFEQEHPDWQYAEGYVLYEDVGFPLLHAWAVDREGLAHELTMHEPGIEYRGIIVPKDKLTETIARRGAYGVLDNWENDHPLLQSGTKVFGSSKNMKNFPQGLYHNSKQWLPHEDDVKDYMLGQCAAWAEAHQAEHPHLKFGIDWERLTPDHPEYKYYWEDHGEDPAEGYWDRAQHIFTHDDKHAYDVEGAHPLNKTEWDYRTLNHNIGDIEGTGLLEYGYAPDSAWVRRYAPKPRNSSLRKEARPWDQYDQWVSPTPGEVTPDDPWFYHASPSRNRESILREGLQHPSEGSHKEYWFGDDPEYPLHEGNPGEPPDYETDLDWELYAGDHPSVVHDYMGDTTEPYDVWAFQMPDKQPGWDPHDFWGNTGHRSWMGVVRIPPGRLVLHTPWEDQGFEKPRTSAATRTQLLQQAQSLPEDQSRVIHDYGDGWTMRELQTFGDAEREGQLMSHCFSPEADNAHRVWASHPDAIFNDDEYDEEGDLVDEGQLAGVRRPEGRLRYLDQALPEPLWSLRDPDNLPHASIDGLDPTFYDVRGGVALGRHNSIIKPEYAQRIREYMDSDPHNPLSAHGVGEFETEEGEHNDDPLRFHRHSRLDLPHEDTEEWPHERRQAGVTKTQLKEMANEHEREYGPDTSKIVYDYGDGWTVRGLLSNADHWREGDLMGNCVGDSSFIGGGEAHEKLDSPAYYSLRDPNNIPVATWLNSEGALGRHNDIVKAKYIPYLNHLGIPYAVDKCKNCGDSFYSDNPNHCYGCAGSRSEFGQKWQERRSGKTAAKSKIPEGGLYHVAPTEDRARILQHGLQPSQPFHNPRWGPPPHIDWADWERDNLMARQPEGVYGEATEKQSQQWEDAKIPMDRWHIPADQIREVKRDPIGGGWVIPHGIENPVLFEKAEDRLPQWKGWPEDTSKHPIKVVGAWDWDFDEDFEDDKEDMWEPSWKGFGESFDEEGRHITPQVEDLFERGTPIVYHNPLGDEEDYGGGVKKRWPDELHGKEGYYLRPDPNYPGTHFIHIPELGDKWVSGEYLRRRDGDEDPVWNEFWRGASWKFGGYETDPETGRRVWVPDYSGERNAPLGFDLFEQAVASIRRLLQRGETINDDFWMEVLLDIYGKTHIRLDQLDKKEVWTAINNAITFLRERGDKPHGEGSPNLYKTDAPWQTPKLVAPEIMGFNEFSEKAKDLIPGWGNPYPAVPETNFPGYQRWTRTAAMTNKRLMEHSDYLEDLHGQPDTSKVVHEFPDGWTVRKIQNLADLNREGDLMSNCWAAHRWDWDNQWYSEDGKLPHFTWDWEKAAAPDPERPYSQIKFNPGYNWQTPVGSEYYSLRDPYNIPRASVGGPDRQARGRHNAEIKPEYADRIMQWADQSGDKNIQRLYGNPSRLYSSMQPQRNEWSFDLSRMSTNSQEKVADLAPLVDYRYDNSDDDYYYHISPIQNRERIRAHGLFPSDPHAGRYKEDLKNSNQPVGVYFFATPERAQNYTWSGMRKNPPYQTMPQDLWRSKLKGHELKLDPELNYPGNPSAYYTEQHVRPEDLEHVGVVSGDNTDEWEWSDIQRKEQRGELDDKNSKTQKTALETDWGQDWNEWVAMRPEYIPDGKHHIGYDPKIHKEGKGIVLKDGTVWTWPTHRWRPIHSDYWGRAKMGPYDAEHARLYPPFSIDGNILWVYGEGRKMSPELEAKLKGIYPDIEAKQTPGPPGVTREDIQELGGRNVSMRDIYEKVKQREKDRAEAEAAGGYGHARNILDILDKDDKTSSWNFGREASSRSLYHGTVKDNLDSIKRFGLLPGVGSFVNDAYKDVLDAYEEAGLSLDPLVFMADKSEIDRSYAAMINAIANKLNKDYHDVNINDIRNHGLIVKHPSRMGESNIPGSDNYYGPNYRDEWDESYYVEYPPHVEPGDYFSEEGIHPSDLEYLHGPALLRFMNNSGSDYAKRLLNPSAKSPFSASTEQAFVNLFNRVASSRNLRQANIPVNYMAQIDPETLWGNFHGYANRWPTVYDGKTLHIGPEGSMHSQIESLLPTPTVMGNSHYQGWIGHNPESDPGDKITRHGDTLVGWYGMAPPDHVNDRAAWYHQTFLRPTIDPNAEQGYGHARRFVGGWQF